MTSKKDKNLVVCLISLFICASAFSMDRNKIIAACEAAAIKKYHTLRTDQYGNTAGIKVEKTFYYQTYDKNLTNQMGFGNNYLSLISITGEIIKQGRYDSSLNLDLKCITNEKNKVIGMEIKP